MKMREHLFSSWALTCIIDNAIFYGHSFGCSRLYIIIVLANKVDMYELFRPFPISYTIIKALIKIANYSVFSRFKSSNDRLVFLNFFLQFYSYGNYLQILRHGFIVSE